MAGFWRLLGLTLLVLVACGSSPSIESTRNATTSPLTADQALVAADEIDALKQEIRLLEAQVAVLVKFVTDVKSDLSELEQEFLCYHVLTSC